MSSLSCRRRIPAASAAGSVVLAGIVAGVVSTLVQVVLWVALTDAFPATLFRDARLAAAIYSALAFRKAADRRPAIAAQSSSSRPNTQLQVTVEGDQIVFPRGRRTDPG